MAKDPAFLLYSQDFLIGCAEMNNEEIGQYFRILLYMHQKGRLKEETIRFLVGSLSVIVKSKFVVDETGLWYNERLEEEIEKRRIFVDSRKNNGSLGGRPKKEKPLGKPNDNLSENENENENENEDDNEISEDNGFERFWDTYDKKIDRDKCVKKWNTVKRADRQKIFETLPDYVRATPDKHYRKNPLTYLNSKAWENEIIKGSNGKRTKGIITGDEILASKEAIYGQD